MKKALALIIIFCATSCAELQTIVDSLPQNGVALTNDQIAGGLRQALDKGIDQQVSKLTQKNGFYRNELVKILLPEELQKVDNALRKIGLGDLADEGLKLMNRAAEDAVKEATPIFVNAVKEITFADARNILLGADDAATNYLSYKTKGELYTKFYPQIESSFAKVGADKIWENLIQRYNSIPLTENVNTNLTDYVTKEALQGVYTMIAVEEKQIRTNINERTTDLLKRVFALQDGQ
ncbi:DUF4197 domain-containing protein [Gangjinia marincola]|uniref:DUF4197 domain-containing protein n=1 Tax=Gangjinia marincola TaxID=578463 RepID=A0ABN1MK80_9FLAO